MQLAHGATEEEGIKVALSLGNPASLPAAADLLPADKPGQQTSVLPPGSSRKRITCKAFRMMHKQLIGWLGLSGPPCHDARSLQHAAHGWVDAAEDAAETPREGAFAAPPAGPADGDASLGPPADGAHGAGASESADAMPVLAPASLLGPAFVATPVKPSAPGFAGEAPQAPSQPGAAEHSSTGTAEPASSAHNTAAEGPTEPQTAAGDSMVPIQAGTAAGPLAEAAAAHSENSTAEEPSGLSDAPAEPKEPAAPKPAQPDEDADFMPAEGSLSSLHVHSAPSKALDAAERGESPAAPADGDAADASFGAAIAPDAEVAEKAHNVLESNVKAVEAANDSTADTLDAALRKDEDAPAETADKKESEQDIGDSAGLSHMTLPPGESAGNVKVAEPAAESSKLLGAAGAGENKTQPKEGAEAELAAANYHTQGTGQPAEDSAAEPAMADPELLGMAGAGEHKAQPKESAEADLTAANYHTQGTGQPAGDKAAEPAMADPELLGMAGAGEHKAQPKESAEADLTAANYHTQGTGQPAGDKAAEPAMADPELLGMAGAGQHKTQPKEGGEADLTAANYHTQGTGQPAEDSAAEPAMTDPELMGVAAAGVQGSQHAKAEAQDDAGTHLSQPAGDSASAKGNIESGTKSATDIKLSGKEEPALDSSAASMTEADTISKVTQAAAETPGDAKAAEPAAGSVEFLGLAKTTDAASEPSAVSHPAESAATGAPAKSSGSGATEAETIAEITQAAAETPGDARAAEPAEGTVEFLGAAKTTDAASEPAAHSASAVTAPEGEAVCASSSLLLLVAGQLLL